MAVVGLVRQPPAQAWAARSMAFEAANPGISIRQTDYPSETYVSLFTAQQAAGQPNDIMLLNGQDLRRYATNGTLAALDDSDIDLARFRSGALTTGQINGKTYGLPIGSVSGFPVFVNRKVLGKVGADIPTSYDDMLALRDKLKAEGLKVFTHPGKNIYLWPVWFFTVFAQTSGNKSVERTAEILSGTAKFTDDDVVQALELLAQFGKDELITQASFSQDTPQTLVDFSAGRAAFWMQHESLIAQARHQQTGGGRARRHADAQACRS
ncbi:extracellular solute-binding protein [Devosia algicola]|uniref:Extracellular solute-binding protein n=1 Tax=Devosia algicola TaxID=3026418 RepID=A0ABY7YSA3_9HYPH|nr:extracellular solute-binding protein [Devosia algicola]WDR04236.1 extracellular solute-binding protein [Devosia algicola]